MGRKPESDGILLDILTTKFAGIVLFVQDELV